LSFWDEWFKRFGRRDSFFGDFDRMMREMEKEMADMIREMEGNMPDEMRREIKAPDGSTRKEYGPFVYGYSVKIGPDGKPVIREFGNMKPGLDSELPGVEKSDIKLLATSSGLTINVDNPERQYYKELEFDAEIDRKSAKSSYRNGVLEVSFKKMSHVDEGTPINIE